MEKKIISLVYPEFYYKIVGVAFNIYNELGHGHKELFYQISESPRRGFFAIRIEI